MLDGNNRIEGSGVDTLVNPVQITDKVMQFARNPNAESLTLRDINGPATDAEVAAAVALQSSDFGHRVIRELFPHIDTIHDAETVQNLHQAVGLVGAYTFSFPLWRMPAIQPKNADGKTIPSFFEKRDMEKVRRVSDKRPPRPDGIVQDWLGSGYRLKNGAATFDQRTLDILREQNIDPRKVYIEYRRSYILISIEGEGSLAIRNSSYYFGRDNFQHVAYFSQQHLSDEEVEGFCPQIVDGPSPRLRALLDPGHSWSLSNSRNLLILLTVFQSVNRSFFDFGKPGDGSDTFDLTADNWHALLDHLTERISLDRGAASYPILGVLDADLPPWSPHYALRVTPEILSELSTTKRVEESRSPAVRAFIHEAAEQGRTVGLMSSIDGDLPFQSPNVRSTRAHTPLLARYIQSKVKKDLTELGIDGLVEPESSTLFPNFRQLDFPKTVQSTVDWLATEVRLAPGLVVSISGTDSILTFALCAKALKALGRDPQRELIGLHFRSPRSEKYPYDWLSHHGCVQSLEPPVSDPKDADIQRWAAVQSFAIRHGRLWIVGSRNATETHTGDYSVASNCCSVFPIANLLKTEVLNICHTLGVPLKDMNQSLAPDPECDAACTFQSRRVVSMDCFVLDDLNLLPPHLRTAQLSPDVRKMYDQRVAEGRFRRAYQRFNIS